MEAAVLPCAAMSSSSAAVPTPCSSPRPSTAGTGPPLPAGAHPKNKIKKENVKKNPHAPYPAQAPQALDRRSLLVRCVVETLRLRAMSVDVRIAASDVVLPAGEGGPPLLIQKVCVCLCVCLHAFIFHTHDQKGGSWGASASPPQPCSSASHFHLSVVGCPPSFLLHSSWMHTSLERGLN